MWSTPTQVYTAWKALPATTDFRWHKLYLKRGTAFSNTSSLIVSFVQKLSTDSCPQMWKKSKSRTGRHRIQIMKDFRSFGIAQLPYVTRCLGHTMCFQKLLRIPLNLFQCWDPADSTCSKRRGTATSFRPLTSFRPGWKHPLTPQHTIPAVGTELPLGATRQGRSKGRGRVGLGYALDTA